MVIYMFMQRKKFGNKITNQQKPTTNEIYEVKYVELPPLDAILF